MLLSDILGTDEDVITRGMEQEAERRQLRQALGCLSGRERRIINLRFGFGREDEKRNDAEGGRGFAWNFAVLYFKAGKKDYEAAEKRNDKSRMIFYRDSIDKRALVRYTVG